MPAFIFKWSAESIRGHRFWQAMKARDPLLAAWQSTVSRKGDGAAVFDSMGKIARSFRDIEEGARAFYKKIDTFPAGAVVAVQIGNHQDWPSVFIASLRKQLVVLPLDQSISERQRDAALEICQATAVVSAATLTGEDVTGETDLGIVRLTTAGSTVDWGDNPPSLLKLTSGATVFPGTPVFYQAFCNLGDVPAQPKLRLCISAGAPLSGAVAKKFFEKFKQPIHSFYGASECGGICYDQDGTTFDDGLVGRPMQRVEIEFIEPTASSSQIRVRSAAVSDGYFPEGGEQKLGNGVFVPDDLLAQHNSALTIVGRVSDVINVAGKKVNPAEIEAQLLRFEGVRQAVVFGRSTGAGLRNEEVAACVQASPQTTENDLLRFCRDFLSPWQVPKRIFIVGAIPTNERGKMSRRDLSRRFSQ